MHPAMIRFDRILGILLHLRAGKPVAAGDLARQFGVSRRTIYRDMDTLSALGVPVYAERGLAGGFRLLPGYFLPPLMFSRGEAVSLVLGLALWRSLRGRPLMAELETAERKLLAALPDELRQLLANSDELVGFEEQPPDLLHPEPPPAEHETPPPDAVSRTGGTFLQAILDGRQVSMQYHSPYREQRQRIIASPLAMFWDRDRWYLVGRRSSPFGPTSKSPAVLQQSTEAGLPPASKDVGFGTTTHGAGSRKLAGPAEDRQARTEVWRADRVLDIQPHGEPCAPRPAFDVRSLLGRRWLAPAMEQWMRESPVTIRMSAEQAALLQQDWYYRHARFEPDDAGGTRMTYGADQSAEVFALLRWLGPGAELVEPRAWRQQVAAELRQMLAAHTDP